MLLSPYCNKAAANCSYIFWAEEEEEDMEIIYQPYFDPEFEYLIERIYPPWYVYEHKFINFVLEIAGENHIIGLVWNPQGLYR